MYRSTTGRGVAAVFDFLSDAAPGDGRGWTARGVLHVIDPHLDRADLLHDPELREVFARLQGRRRLPEPAAQRLRALLPVVPFGGQR